MAARPSGFESPLPHHSTRLFNSPSASRKTRSWRAIRHVECPEPGAQRPVEGPLRQAFIQFACTLLSTMASSSPWRGCTFFTARTTRYTSELPTTSPPASLIIRRAKVARIRPTDVPSFSPIPRSVPIFERLAHESARSRCGPGGRSRRSFAETSRISMNSRDERHATCDRKPQELVAARPSGFEPLLARLSRERACPGKPAGAVRQVRQSRHRASRRRGVH